MAEVRLRRWHWFCSPLLHSCMKHLINYYIDYDSLTMDFSNFDASHFMHCQQIKVLTCHLWWHILTSWVVQTVLCSDIHVSQTMSYWGLWWSPDVSSTFKRLTLVEAKYLINWTDCHKFHRHWCPSQDILSGSFLCLVSLPIIAFHSSSHISLSRT